MNDEYYMKKALNLAKRGLGKTSPNPMVGALIVKDDVILGQGYHHSYGGNHAEINAIRDAREDIRGSTLYVTLEPCCHRNKKTPPCLDTLLKYSFKRVVVGTLDPNPAVNGRSLEALRKYGVETKVGVLEAECCRLNEVFFKYIRTGIPFVTLKVAQTLDGRIASMTGDSRWISSQPSLKLAHKLRSTHDAVLVGIGTVLKDDPQLTVRYVKGRSPVRVVIDSRLRVPPDARILKEQGTAPTIVATTRRADRTRQSQLELQGIDTVTVEEEAGGELDVSDLLIKLGKRNISSVLVEGGAAVITSFIRRELADKYVLIMAPKIMGKGLDAVGDLGRTNIDNVLKLSFDRIYRSGEDLVVEARVRTGP